MTANHLPLSFREKSARVTLVLLVAVFVPLTVSIYRQLTGTGSPPEALIEALALLVLFVFGEIVLQAAMAARMPGEAQASRDERERLIGLRATNVAFTVLVAGVLAAVAVVLVRNQAWLVAQAVLLAVVAAELVRYGVQVALYRRDR